MPTQKQQHTLQLYADLREEVKHSRQAFHKSKQRKVAALLNMDRISLPDGAMHILCTMDTGPARKVEVVIAERVSPPGA